MYATPWRSGDYMRNHRQVPCVASSLSLWLSKCSRSATLKIYTSLLYIHLILRSHRYISAAIATEKRMIPKKANFALPNATATFMP